MCGPECSLLDPCQESEPCMNGAMCVETCTTFPDYKCQCLEGFVGKNCSEQVRNFEESVVPDNSHFIFLGTSKIRHISWRHCHNCHSHHRGSADNLRHRSHLLLSNGEKQASHSRHLQPIGARIL